MSETGYMPPMSMPPVAREQMVSTDVGPGWGESPFSVDAQGVKTLPYLDFRGGAMIPTEQLGLPITALVDSLEVILGQTFFALQNPQLTNMRNSLAKLTTVYNALNERLDRMEVRQKRMEKLLEQFITESRRAPESKKHFRSVPLKALRDLMPELNEPVTQEEREALARMDPDVVAAFMREDER